MASGNHETGKLKWLAPIEVKDKADLACLNITWADCKTWRIGRKSIRVYLVETNKDVHDFLLAQLRTANSKEFRQNRCEVLGKRNRIIACPDVNSCAHCPYGLSQDEKVSLELSLDGFLESGYDPSASDRWMDASIAQMDYDVFLEKLCKKDPDLGTIIEMRRCGFSIQEIARAVGKAERTVYKALRKARRVASQYTLE